VVAGREKLRGATPSSELGPEVILSEDQEEDA
jgi:hypothetical protein